MSRETALVPSVTYEGLSEVEQGRCGGCYFARCVVQRLARIARLWFYAVVQRLLVSLVLKTPHENEQTTKK